MGHPDKAIDIYQQYADKVVNFRSSQFFLEHPQYNDFAGGLDAITKFLLDRPAMLVSDGQNLDGILGFIDKEWYESEHAENVEGEDELYSELGDTAFFALLAGMLHWEDMDESQKDFVERSIVWSQDMAKEKKMNIYDAVEYVASVKDPINYRQDFYQLIDGEEANEVYDRVVSIGKLHRKIREKLNGDWKNTDNLLGTLAKHWLDGNPETDIAVIQIEALFGLAGIDLLAHIGI